MNKLPIEDVQGCLEKLPNWTLRDEKWIERKFIFKQFMQSMLFANDIAVLAEENAHHPFINIQYKIVIISLTSWNAKGLTDLDFNMATEIERLYEESIQQRELG